MSFIFTIIEGVRGGVGGELLAGWGAGGAAVDFSVCIVFWFMLSWVSAPFWPCAVLWFSEPFFFSVSGTYLCGAWCLVLSAVPMLWATIVVETRL